MTLDNNDDGEPFESAFDISLPHCIALVVNGQYWSLVVGGGVVIIIEQ